MKNSVYWIHTKTYIPENNTTYKGKIEAFNMTTKAATIFNGVKELRSGGFTPSAVYNCINPQKKWNKSHKGHTFKRLEK